MTIKELEKILRHFPDDVPIKIGFESTHNGTFTEVDIENIDWKDEDKDQVNITILL